MIRPTVAITAAGFLAKRSGSFIDFGMNWATSGTKIQFYDNSGAGYVIASYAYTPPTNQWTVIHGVRSGANRYIYLNGVQVGARTAPTRR